MRRRSVWSSSLPSPPSHHHTPRKPLTSSAGSKNESDPNPIFIEPHVVAQPISVASPISAQPIFVAPPAAANLRLRVKDKREQKLSKSRRSPYKMCVIDLKNAPTQEEENVSEWLFNIQGDVYSVDVPSDTKYAPVLNNLQMQWLIKKWRHTYSTFHGRQ
ncbi:unnamed protein product [Lactuca virosa]|uniref:Uncharacterized protein n=1 Tax=Lactuca virosa TaxID=75947 RepID=A0AAU9MU97_9ASTR|nr:unnamed protein product [Lactuca virosa]